MDTREKLAELVNGVLKYLPYGEISSHTANDIANRLISNGVTVQEWISVEDRLPPYDQEVLVYRPDMAIGIISDSYFGFYGEDDGEWYEGWNNYGRDVAGNPVITHWMPMPEPPKGE